MTAAAAEGVPRLVPDVLLRRERVSLSLSEPGVDGRAIVSRVELRRRAVPMREDHLPPPLLGEESDMVVKKDRLSVDVGNVGNEGVVEPFIY